MGNMTSTEPPEPSLREAALALHRKGKGRQEIRRILGVTEWRLSLRLRDAPSLNRARRRNVKDELRERARKLRLQGWTCPEIARKLNVSKSSVSLWVRDLPKPASRWTPEQWRDHLNETYWEPWRRQREIARQREKLRAAREIGALSDRELFLVGAALYWAEGSKDKPYRRQERVTFTNSDPSMVLVYLRWLDLLGVPEEDRSYRVAIHETADIEAAENFWADLVGVERSRRLKTTLKRHDPKTNRRNVGDKYRGCLEVRVRKSSELYRRIEGWWAGIADAATRHAVGLHRLIKPVG